MSYQVLARKWRPSTFEEMVGQTHVLRALVNALDQGRLHHAYLFTGTRGVGKTTIARLLAKSLNCEQGVSSKPCGVCSSCVEIAEGRFVDLIEVDAASRTKVEDTRELLENVQYAPTRGRFKVYLIDEVHMLTTNSFNALLKTLEEPPPYVKFLLATTDPQKLPVTVLSRCLQFNLKNMSREHIVQHLTHILTEESVPFDDPSLWSIAEGAQGSMRDALSLTDQAIAFGQGVLREKEVAAMLGTVDLRRVIKLVHALLEKQGGELMRLVAEIDEHSPDFQSLMTELMSTLHRVAIAQAVPNAIDNQKGDQQAILKLASASYAEDVHLYYQIAAKAKSELSLAPSERAGFEMALLRMLAFSQTPPASIGELPELHSDLVDVSSGEPSVPKPQPQSAEAKSEPVESEQPIQHATPSVDSEPEIISEEAIVEPDQDSYSTVGSVPDEKSVTLHDAAPAEPTVTENNQTPAKLKPAPEPEPSPPVTAVQDEVSPEEPRLSTAVDTSSVTEISQYETEATIGSSTVATWPDVDRQADPHYWWQVTLHRLGLAGMTKTLFANSQWQNYSEGTLYLMISQNYRKIMNDSHQDYLLKSIVDWLPECQRLHYEFGAVEKTPQMWVEQLLQKANDQAYDYLQQDPFISQLMKDFQGELQRESAVPNNSPIPSGA